MTGSIRTRMIVAMNLLVVGVGAAVGWVGVQVAGRAIEDRLTGQAASNAASLAGEMRLPLRSNELMLRMSRILGSHVASGPGEGGSPVAASSLPPAQQAELAEQLTRSANAGRVTLRGVAYRVGSARATALAGDSPASEGTLYVLVPEAQINIARGNAATRIAWLTLAAIAVATGIAIWLSTTISRPVRQLANRMDRLASAPGEGEGNSAKRQATGAASHPSGTATGEIAQLERSFDQLLARLDETRDQLARSARMATLGQLAASVAHELRNPLSGIKMNARVLADELAQRKITDRCIELIIREIDRMDLYLEELLDLSASAAGKPGRPPQAKLADVRLSELAESVLALLAGRCRHSQVDVVRDFSDGPAALPVRGDANHLRQVVLNLMLNALDAMPHGGRMTVSIQPTPDGMRFSVADTGGGVKAPPGVDIFDPFVTTKPDGTGLGLALCRQVITRHTGRIGYDSAADGTVFWFELTRGE